MSSDACAKTRGLVLSLLLFTSSASAQTDCAAIPSDRERLACYDRQVTERPSSAANKVQAVDLPQLPLGKDSGSILSNRWELEGKQGRFLFRPYKPVYFFPIFYQRNLNRLPTTENPRTSVSQVQNLDHLEAKFQLSFKTKLADGLISDHGDLWLGYTQTSRWQIYNVEESRPFRETNHEPEFIFTLGTNYHLLGFDGRLLSLSLNHQSNGQDEPLSRSWNRVILTVGLERPNWVVLMRPWWRIPESSDEEDENPNIVDYVGRAEFLIVHRRRNSHQISTRIRHSLRDGEDSRGSIDLNWTYPCFDRLRCHAQLFHGYGESLIDYNHDSTAIGLGVNLLEWFE